MPILETTPSITDPVATLIQYGVTGLILLLLLMGYLWPKPAVDQMLKRQDEERKLLVEQILPAVNRLARSLDVNNGLLRQELRSRGIRPEEALDDHPATN